MAMAMTGNEALLIFLYDGLRVSDEGRSACDATMAACTSRAAPSISRSIPKVSWMFDVPTPLDDVMSSTSAMAPRCRSKGVATVLAITSGLAPGSAAETKIAGTSMRGRGATGSSVNATAPQSATPTVNRIVATGRRMKGAEMFTWNCPPTRRRGRSATFCREHAPQAGRRPGRSPAS